MAPTFIGKEIRLAPKRVSWSINLGAKEEREKKKNNGKGKEKGNEWGKGVPLWSKDRLLNMKKGKPGTPRCAEIRQNPRVRDPRGRVMSNSCVPNWDSVPAGGRGKRPA